MPVVFCVCVCVFCVCVTLCVCVCVVTYDLRFKCVGRTRGPRGKGWGVTYRQVEVKRLGSPQCGGGRRVRGAGNGVP